MFHRRKVKGPFVCLLALTPLMCRPSNADVPAPPTPPAPPTGYCSEIYNERTADLQAFNSILLTPPTWIPVPGGPTLYAVSLQAADGNTGPGLASPGYISSVEVQLQEEKALGVQAVMIEIGFPALYAPFQGGQTQLQPYLTFYSQVAQAVRTAGLKLIVENNILLADDIDTGWSNLNSYFASLTWPEYMAARATMAATVAETLQPDYLVLAQEPDSEASNSGQPNVYIAADAAQMVAGEIAAVQALNLPNIQLGAGFGTWLGTQDPNSLVDYITAYLALPGLDFIDIHIYPILTPQPAGISLIANSLVVAQAAALAGKPIAMSECWDWKLEDNEYGVYSSQYFRARDAFSFWGPLDAYFLQTMQNLANYTNMLYASPEQVDYQFAYQTYGGTTANGGAATCTCTTDSCSEYEIVHDSNSLSSNATAIANFSTTGLSYYNQLVTTPDTTPPTMPTGLTGGAGYTNANFSWTASTDNVAVAGYNIFRCQPTAQFQSCTGVYYDQTTSTTYIDSGPLTSNTPYNYQVEAFDTANNNSPLSTALFLLTLRTSADSPTALTAKPISGKEIDLSWSPPSDTTGLSSYLIFAGNSPTNLAQIAKTSSSTTTYRDLNLNAATDYYYGVEAVESGKDSAMCPTVKSTTLPLPNPPANIATTPEPTTITISWQENPPQNGLPVTDYQIWEGPTSVGLTKVATVPAPTTSYTARSLTASTLYFFEITAVDSNNDDSVPSSEFYVRTLPLPPAPGHLAATTPSATQIALTWKWTALPNGLPISHYLVDCGTSSSGPPQVGQSSTTSYTYRSASPATEYYCQVIAVDTQNNQSQPSAQITATTPPMPAAPVDVTATAGSATKITVGWTENIPAGGLPITNYTVWWGTSPTGLSKLATTSKTSYSQTSLSPSTTYYYAVTATDSGNDISPMSGSASATTDAAPAAPQNVTPTASSGTNVVVTWSETVPTGGLPISNYTVYRGATATSLSKLATTAKTTYTDTTVVAGNTYYYAVEATDNAQDISPMSTAVPVTTP